MREGKNGITVNTPDNIMFGAGTIHKGLVYTAGEGSTAGSWNFTESCIGATSGGSSLNIAPEITTVPIDGALVRTKGLDVKTGEVAKLEINFAEITKEIIKAATMGADGTSADSNYSVVESKADIESGDYFTNIAFVGKTLGGDKIIAILDNAICTSGFTAQGRNKEGSVGTYTFECSADIATDQDLDTLPWHIYYPA